MGGRVAQGIEDVEAGGVEDAIGERQRYEDVVARVPEEAAGCGGASDGG